MKYIQSRYLDIFWEIAQIDCCGINLEQKSQEATISKYKTDTANI